MGNRHPAQGNGNAEEFDVHHVAQITGPTRDCALAQNTLQVE